LSGAVSRATRLVAGRPQARRSVDRGRGPAAGCAHGPRGPAGRVRFRAGRAVPAAGDL